MTTQVFDQVQAALEAEIESFSGAPEEPATGRKLIAFENDRFEPPEDKVWWRVRFVPTTVQRGSLGEGGYSRIDGEMLVELYYPAGGGSGEARRAADDLMNHFKSGTRITSDDGVTVSVWRVWRSPGVQEPRWYHVTVNVWWTVHRTEL